MITTSAKIPVTTPARQGRMRPSFVTPVVVGVDGSASSLSAVRAAAEQASLYGCPLHVVHAFNWLARQPDPLDTHPAATANELIQQAVAVAHRTSPDITIATRLLEGAPSSALLRQARTAAVLAIGDGGLSSHTCLPTHTSAVHVAARARCSVLVARATPSSTGSVLVGVSGSAASERALDFAFDAAARRGTDLIVVRAETSETAAGGNGTDLVRGLTDLVVPREDKYRVTARIRVLDGDPAAVLLAESKHAGLIVAGARGRWPYRGLLGSAAQALLHHSAAPLILVRGPMPRPPEPMDQALPAAATI